MNAAFIEANGFWNHFTGKKKWTITCGGCRHTWKEKVPIREPSSAICPSCGTQNIWSATNFDERYRRQHELPQKEHR